MMKSDTEPTSISPRQRASRAGGYDKGDAAAQRILEVALREFGAGRKEATTRRIAEAAGVTLPAIQYYFGNKDGLYLACAREIVAQYQVHTGPAARAALAALREDGTPEAAREHLKAIFAALAELLVGSPEARTWAAFVLREIHAPGPAFELLYTELWEPGVALAAKLVSRACGERRESAGARVQALLLISSLTAFQSGRTVAMRTLQWTEIGPREVRIVSRALQAQIDRLGRD